MCYQNIEFHTVTAHFLLGVTTEKKSKYFLTGKVLAGYGSFFTVLYKKSLFSCTLRGKFRRISREEHNPIAVGDRVKFSRIDDTSGVIEELLPRKNKISRPTKWGPVKERIFASNVDQIVAVVSTKDPRFTTGLIDRMLLVAERENLKGIICINKIDLIDVHEIDNSITAYRKLRYVVVPMSAKTGAGIRDMKSLLQNKFSVFIGQSGVGKSSILNRLDPGLNLRVQEISMYSNKGRHTTSSVTAVPLSFGGVIADTPGFRDFGLWGIDQNEVCGLFREFRRYTSQCKYQPCFHVHEPKCSVKTAYEKGRITSWRYENYVRIFDSFTEPASYGQR